MNRKILVSILFVLSVALGSFSTAQATFKDDAQISSEAKKAVNYTKENRIMIGYNDLFSPKNVITR